MFSFHCNFFLSSPAVLGFICPSSKNPFLAGCFHPRRICDRSNIILLLMRGPFLFTVLSANSPRFVPFGWGGHCKLVPCYCFPLQLLKISAWFIMPIHAKFLHYSIKFPSYVILPLLLLPSGESFHFSSGFFPPLF